MNYIELRPHPKDSPTLFEPDDLHLPAMASSLINKIAFGENAGKSVRRLYAGTHKWPEDVKSHVTDSSRSQYPDSTKLFIPLIRQSMKSQQPRF